MDGNRVKPWWVRLAETNLRAPRMLARAAGRAGRLLVPAWSDLVGVDVIESSVKIVRVRRGGPGGFRLVKAERRAGATEAKPADRRARVAETLRELVLEAGARGALAATTIGGPDVLIRRVTLPEMKRADLLPALALECRKHVTGPVDSYEIRYEVIGRSEASGNPALDLLVTVAPRRKIEETRELLEQAGLKPVCITLRPAALVALLDTAETIAWDEVVAYLDMGAAESHITVLKGREVRFARELGVGGATLTEALRSIVVPGQGNVDLTHDQAETLKRAHGVPLGAEEAGSAGRIPLSAVSIMLRPTLERLVRELWNSFDYVNEQFQGESVARVVLLGDGSRMKNLPEYLAGVLKMPVARADASERVASLAVRAGAPDAATVSELGLGLALVRRTTVNFLAPSESSSAHRFAEAIPHKAAAVAAALLLLSVSLPAEVTVLRERQRVETLRGSLDSVRPRAEALRRFRAAREEETRLHDLLARLSGGQVLWSYVLRDLSHRVRENVRLTSLEVVEPAPAAGAAATAGIPGREVRLGGLLRTEAERPEKVLGELMQSLAQSPVFDQVRLEGCQTVTSGLSSFTITVRVAE